MVYNTKRQFNVHTTSSKRHGMMVVVMTVAFEMDIVGRQYQKNVSFVQLSTILIGDITSAKISLWPSDKHSRPKINK